RRVVRDVEGDALRLARDAGVAGRAEQPVGQRARRDLPGERVLAPARAEKEDVHARCRPERGLGCEGAGLARSRRAASAQSAFSHLGPLTAAAALVQPCCSEVTEICYSGSMTKEQVKKILDRVLTWPPERQVDVAHMVELMEEQDQR